MSATNSSDAPAASNTINPTTGRCTLHPGIQLKLLLNRNNDDDGEWRTLLKACPLCVSGLPPTAIASAVAAEAAASRSSHTNNNPHRSGQQQDNTEVTRDDDLDEKISLKKQQLKHKKKKKSPKKKKKKHSSSHKHHHSSNNEEEQQVYEKSPRGRPRSPSHESPYTPKQTIAIDGDDGSYAMNDQPTPQKLFEQNEASPPPPRPTKSPSQQQPSRTTSRNSDTGDFVDRMNGTTFRQFVERDKQRQGGGSISGQQQQHPHRMEQGGGGRRSGGNNAPPPPNGYYDHSSNNYVEGRRQQQQQQPYNDDDDGEASVGSYYSSSSARRRLDLRQSEVSSQGSQYLSAAERAASRSRSRQGDVSQGTYYSSAQSRHEDEEVSDNESYYSTDEESSVDNETESYNGSHTSYCEEEQSRGVAPEPNHREQQHYNVRSPSQDAQYQQQQRQHSHLGQQQNEWTSPRHHQQVHGGGGISQQQHHQQWQQQQQQQNQSFHRRTPPPSQNSVRPDPEDYHECHPSEPPQISAAERMMRHRQYNTSLSPLQQQQASPYSQTQSPQQTEFDSQEEDESDNVNHDDDDDDDDNEREVLEPEDVSIISMNSSASRNLTRAKQQQKRRELDLQKREQGSQMDPDDEDDDERPIKTCEYDQKGRCVRHPHYQLRKKKMFKGWVTLLSNCPECCLDEMKRVKKKYQERVSSPEGGSSIHSNSVSSAKKKKKKKKKKSSQLPPITQLNVSNSRGSGVDDSSSGTASTFTIASSSNTSGRWQNYLSSNASVASAPPTTARVTRLPYNDQYNGNGWYTGQVSMAGIPHGWGMMNYANGHTFEGEWRNGVSVAKTREAPPVLGRGGEGGNFYSPSHHHHPSSHQVHSSPHEQRRGGGSVIDPPVSRRQMTQLEPLRESPSPSIRSRNKPNPRSRSRIVSNMPYRDNRNFVIGAYTGEVDEYHVPYGIGTMRYNDGLVSEGRWIDGELDDGYNVTDDEDGDDDASYKSSGARSAPGVTRYHHDGYQNRQNLNAKLSSLEAKLSTVELNSEANWR